MKKLFLAVLLFTLPALASAQAAAPAGTTWAVQHQPAAAAAATITKAAAGANYRNVATSITVCIVATAAQPSITFNLRDGATGAGNILWSAKLAGVIGAGQCVSLPVFIAGSVNTAMTLESSGAPAATNFANVALTGYTVRKGM